MYMCIYITAEVIKHDGVFARINAPRMRVVPPREDLLAPFLHRVPEQVL